MHSRRTHSIELRHISEALMLSGHTSLDEQAKALGVHRSTAWTIVKNKHKLGRLSAKTVDRILRNPQTPPTVRAIVQQYWSKDQNRTLFSKNLVCRNKTGLRLV
jgi:plasmid maintenance system antidote protein VapI